MIMGGPSGVVVNELDCDIIVNKFKLQLHHYLFSDKYPWEKYEFPYPSSYGSNSTTVLL